jgi:hypothetical protein
MAVDPATVDQVGHDRGVDVARSAHVEDFHASSRAKRSKPQPRGQFLGITFCRLPIDQQSKSLFEAVAFEHGVGATLFVKRWAMPVRPMASSRSDVGWVGMECLLFSGNTSGRVCWCAAAATHQGLVSGTPDPAHSSGLNGLRIPTAP